ncbi:hypothetical protein BRW84_07210 [Oxalobacter formigenes OXCC13]|nr:hypothetical protein BRW84_07210 [Oxalobacter formigenes OXCC13]
MNACIEKPDTGAILTVYRITRKENRHEKRLKLNKVPVSMSSSKGFFRFKRAKPHSRAESHIIKEKSRTPIRIDTDE